MKYNGKLLGKARLELSRIHENNIAEHERRLARVYASVPVIEQIDQQLKQQMIDLARLVFSGESADMEKVRQDNLTLQMKRLEALVGAGFPQNYLDEIFNCPVCHDTGYDVNRRNCKCLDVLYNKALTRELSSLMLSGDESFDKFDLTLYPSNAQQHMKDVFILCQEYSSSCADEGLNLLLFGPPGLGKTYLSACIARELVAQGKSVVYDTCANVINTFELKQFGKDSEQEDAKIKVDSMLNCDLMILDDLGTEYTTPAAMSALYTLINTRITTHKATVINTNLNPEDLPKRYSPAISSRISGCYTALDFVGTDIRKILKERL